MKLQIFLKSAPRGTKVHILHESDAEVQFFLPCTSLVFQLVWEYTALQNFKPIFFLKVHFSLFQLKFVVIP